MSEAGFRRRGVVFAAVLGALGGGLITVIATKAVPKMMAQMKAMAESLCGILEDESPVTGKDIAFFKKNGSTLSSFWDDGNNQWNYFTTLVMKTSARSSPIFSSSSVK